jgi:hypothetical protein
MKVFQEARVSERHALSVLSVQAVLVLNFLVNFPNVSNMLVIKAAE